jgi:hypothetical protein
MPSSHPKYGARAKSGSTSIMPVLLAPPPIALAMPGLTPAPTEPAIVQLQLLFHVQATFTPNSLLPLVVYLFFKRLYYYFSFFLILPCPIEKYEGHRRL